MLDELGKLGSYLGQTARLMVGLPDYDNYLNHMEKTHPDQAAMTSFSGSGKTPATAVMAGLLVAVEPV